MMGPNVITLFFQPFFVFWGFFFPFFFFNSFSNSVFIFFQLCFSVYMKIISFFLMFSCLPTSCLLVALIGTSSDSKSPHCPSIVQAHFSSAVVWVVFCKFLTLLCKAYWNYSKHTSNDGLKCQLYFLMLFIFLFFIFFSSLYKVQIFLYHFVLLFSVDPFNSQNV